jgi:putative oxidoreductase
VTGTVLALHGWMKFAGGKAVLQGVGANIRVIGIEVGSEGAFALFFGIMAAGSELVGGILLVLGALFRTATAFLIVTMTVATIYKYQQVAGEFGQYGYPLMVLTVLVTLLFTGAGRLGIQRD